MDKPACPTCGKALPEDLHDVLIRWEGAVSEVEREGNDGPEELKELAEARAALLGLLRDIKEKAGH